MTQHIPGPWRLSCKEGDAKRYVVATSERHGQSSGIVLIAQIKQHRLGSADRVAPNEIQDANARLIATAPDLLEALEAMRSEIELISGYWTEGLANFAQMADRVIAKARGHG